MLEITTKYDFTAVADSRIGGRTENQDTFGYDDTPLGLLLVVCDGMGGGPSGKTASMLAAQTFINCIKTASPDTPRINALERAVKETRSVLHEAQVNSPECKGMGTTLAALLINPYSAMVATIGDSRVYQLRGNHRVFMTTDHSQIIETIKPKTYAEEEQARLAPNSNIITRALGPMPEVTADIVELPYEKGDRFLLCSDGIWGMLPGKELVKTAGATRSALGAVEALALTVEETGVMEGNHHDNLTAALLETHHNSKLKQPMSTNVKRLIFALSLLLCISLICNIISFKSLQSDKTASTSATTMTLQPTGNKDFDRQLEELRKQNEEINQKLEAQKEESNRREEQYRRLMLQLGTLLKDSKDPNAKQAIETVNDASATTEIIAKINDLIASLEAFKQLNSSTKSADLNSAEKKCVSQFNDVAAIVKSLGIKNAEFDKCVSEGYINHKMMLKTKDSRRGGHINTIIKSLESLKKTIIPSTK